MKKNEKILKLFIKKIKRNNGNTSKINKDKERNSN